MRSQDFTKLLRYIHEKQQSIYDMTNLLSFNVYVKNDPKECKICISNDLQTNDFTFFEHDDYHSTKFEIDNIFMKLLQ